MEHTRLEKVMIGKRVGRTCEHVMYSTGREKTKYTLYAVSCCGNAERVARRAFKLFTLRASERPESRGRKLIADSSMNAARRFGEKIIMTMTVIVTVFFVVHLSS